jgi:tetratricopeptide (TPR) repeat protein
MSVSGEIRSSGDAALNELIERESISHGQFQLDHVPAGTYSVRLVTAPGGNPLVEEFHEFEPGGAPLVLDLPDRPSDRPISGIVSLRDLEHPVPKKARQEAFEAQQFAHANNLPKAIAKLEQAIRIDPSYRDAHINLGVLYVRLGRTADARAEFQKALDIGPPSAPIYVDLALASSALGDYPAAEAFAHKAQELDPRDATARKVLDFVNRTAMNPTGVTR